MFPPRTRLFLYFMAALHFSGVLTLSLLRYAHVHQRTFDLALYARMAWGLSHGELWSPILNTHVLGVHVAPVLLPLGLLGRLLSTVPVLLSVQALCIACTVFPLARIGVRRLGSRGALLAAAAWLLYPNLWHVGSYEFHPGTLAVLPMTWAFDALDRASLKQLVSACAGILACREDLGAFCALLGIVYFSLHRDRRALYASAGSAAYMALAMLIISRYAPLRGSLDQHFGLWGGSPLGALRALFEEPARLFAHLRERALYLPRVLAPLSFFSLRAPHLLLPALPYLALNLLSAFPTADEQYSHYLTPALPALLVSGLVGVTAVRARFLQMLWLFTLGIGHVALGGSPLSRDFDWAAFRSDADSVAARRVLAAIPAQASVQAPDALLPHLVERHDVRRGPPPVAGSEYVVVDISHRQRFAGKELLLRTQQEPFVRDLLARSDHALLVYAPPYALFALGRAPRSALSRSCLRGTFRGASDDARVLTRCLSVERAAVRAQRLELLLHVQALCPADLALRFGPDAMPARVELLCEGKISPAVLQPYDVLSVSYPLSANELRALRERGLFVGALRASGAAPEPDDPSALPIPLQQEPP